MNQPDRYTPSLAWRLALTAVIVRLVYSALAQSFTIFALPQSDRLREMYSLPQFLAPLLATIAASTVIAGLTTWGTMHQWLQRHNTRAVDEPRKLFGTFIALQLIYTLAVSAAMAALHNTAMQFIIRHRDGVNPLLGGSLENQFLTMSLIVKVATIALEIIGMYAVVRIAAWTVQAAGPAGGPAYDRRHAAWITGLAVLTWQLSVSISLGAFVPMQMLGAGWLEYLLGYLGLPAVLLVLCTQACLKTLPRQIGNARVGRAVAHGSVAFLLAQLMGFGLGFLAIQTMSWGQLLHTAQSQVAAAVTLVIYCALLVLALVMGKQMLYRPASTAEAGR